MFGEDINLKSILTQEIKNLKKIDIQKIAIRSGALLTERKNCLKLPSLNEEIVISSPEYKNIRIRNNPVSLLFKIIILKYLNKTYLNPDMNIKGKWIEKDLFNRVCAELGGKKDENSNEGMIFSLFPKFVLLFKFWPEDKEFPPDIKILFDITASELFSADEIKMILIYFASLMIKSSKKNLQIPTKNV